MLRGNDIAVFQAIVTKDALCRNTLSVFGLRFDINSWGMLRAPNRCSSGTTLGLLDLLVPFVTRHFAVQRFLKSTRSP